MEGTKARRSGIAFEDLTTADQRQFGVYLMRSGNGYSQTYTGSYRQARKLARSRSKYGDIELSLMESIDTPAVD